MATLQDLHQLVHALDKYEKIQVSTNIKALGRKSKDSYMNDYQYIVKQKEYDKTKLKEGLLKIEKRKNLSESNTNLYNFICDILIKVRLNKNKKIGLLRDIQQVEMLFEKGLISQSDKNIQSSKLKSEKIGEDVLQLYMLNNEDKILLRKKVKPSERIKHLESALYQSNQIQNKLEFKILKRKVYALANTIGTPRTEEHLNQYLNLFNNPILKSVNNALTKDSIYEYYDLKILLSTVISEDLNKILKLNKEAINAIKEIYDAKTNVSPEFYLRLYSIEISANHNKKDELIKSIDGLNFIKQYIIQEVHLKIIKTKIIWAWLIFYSKNKFYKEAYDYLREHKSQILDKETDKLSAFNYINIYFAACICFFNKEYNESLEFIETLLERKKTIRQSILPHIHSLYLLNHFKLNNSEYLPYAVKSVYRSFLKNKVLYAPEKELLYFFKVSENKLDTKSDLENLYNKLIVLEEDKLNNSFFDNGVYLYWLKDELNKL